MPAPIGHAPYNVNGEGGRPPNFDAEEIEKLADELILWIREPQNYWYKDFCLEKGINPDRMSDWSKKSERFRGALELARHNQERRIFQGSLENNYNSTMAKLALTNWHKWQDKQEQKIEATTNNTHSWLSEVCGETKNLTTENDDGVADNS